MIEIKTPWKLRARHAGADFYPPCHQRNGRYNNIPCSYYAQVSSVRGGRPLPADQVMGNCFLMGLGYVYFVVMANSGLQVNVEPYDPVYVSQSLLPSLLDFWHNHVIPAFEERDKMGKDRAPVGWIPASNLRNKRPAAGPPAV